MKFARFAAAAALIAIVAACHDRSAAEVRDAGPSVDRNFAVGAFQRIAVSGPYDVTVKSGGQPGVIAHGGQAVLDETEIVVEDGTLKIVPKKKNGFRWSWGNHDKVRVEVTGAGALDGAAIAGSGGISIDQSVSPKFKGEVAGSGDLAVERLQSDLVELSIAGSGNIRAAGKAGRTQYNIAGSGQLDGAALQATDAEVSIAGSGNVTAHATGTADISIMGSGDVSLTGGAKCSVSKQGSGNVSCS